MNITIGVPTKDNINYTKLFLYSLFKYNDFKHQITLVIVDNNSSSENKNWIENFVSPHENIKYQKILLNKNVGTPKSFNLIFDIFNETRGDLCILSNNDVVLSPRWLENLLIFNKDFEEAGIFSPTPIDNHGGIDTLKWFNDISNGAYTPFIDSSWESYANNFREANKHQVDPGVNFCLVVITRECYKNVGIFDEGFIIGCYDDADWLIRAERAGYTAYNTNNSIIFHWGGKTQSEHTKEHGHNSYQQMNKRYFCQKYGVDLDALGARCTRSTFWIPNKDGINERLYI